MEECVFPVADVHEDGIQAGHDLLDLAEEDVSYREVTLGFLLMQFDQALILHERDFYACGRTLDDEFFVHKYPNRHSGTAQSFNVRGACVPRLPVPATGRRQDGIPRNRQ